MMKRRFLTLGKKVVYENPWIKLYENRIKRDDSEGIYSVVERPNSVVIIPLSSNNDTALVKQYRYPIDTDLWELPKGGINAGETKEQAARRELLEETQLQFSKLRNIGEFYPISGLTSQKVAVFIAKVDDQDIENITTPKNVDEIQDVKKVSLNEVYDMVARGVIIDGFTLVALFFLKLYIDSTTNYNSTF